MKYSFQRLQRSTTLFALCSMVMPVIALAADNKASRKPLTEDQKITHVLNRLGFGARPGDIQRVRSIGLKKYVDQQLDASTIDDSVAEHKVEDLEIFKTMKAARVSILSSIILSILAVVPALGQAERFSSTEVDYSFDVPEARWKMTVKPSATSPNVEYVFTDRRHRPR